MDNSTQKLSFAAIKKAVPIDTALAYYGVTLQAQGKALVGSCPIHKGTNKKAFVVSRDRRAWYCFGDCNGGGTVLDLIMQLEDCTLVEAAQLLTDRHGG